MHHTTTHACIPKNAIRTWTIIGLLCIILAFCAGYYIGKKGAARDLIQEMQQELLPSAPNKNPMHVQAVPANSMQLLDLETSATTSQDSWVAHIAGYGTKKAALLCAKKLKNYGIDTQIKEIASVSPKTHKKIVWYQVVTYPFSDKYALEKQIKHVALKEYITGYEIKKV